MTGTVHVVSKVKVSAFRRAAGMSLRRGRND
jgi:hypothetical protein